ncbi:TPA: hypothetical protein ROY10_004422 [Bacillus thuringiensis]|nr:hypothetical protein [Bacillus thuringiensis]
MKFKYYNDTGRICSVHPATFIHGCKGDDPPIKPFEERLFLLPEGYLTMRRWLFHIGKIL